MPVSQKPRRKKTKLQLPKRTSPAPALPDPRGMEGFMSTFGGRQAKDAVTAAQEIMYDAWDQSSPRARVALARKALAVSPLCADAYVLLAEEEGKSKRPSVH